MKSIKNTPATILIVDDNENVLAVLSAFLKREGYQCIEAGSPEKAISVCEGKEAIDIVVSDFYMPNMDGMKLRDNIHKLRPHLKVLFITGNPDKCDALTSEGFICFQKPFSFTELAFTIRRVLQGCSEN